MSAPERTPVRVLDLTLAQVEQLEAQIGLPVTRWREAPSAVFAITSILAAVEGKPRTAYESMTLRELFDRVDFTGSEADPEG